MTFSRFVYILCLIGYLAWPARGPALGQDQEQSVELIMSTYEGAGQSSLRTLYDAIKNNAPKITRQILPLTRAEKWTVPRSDVEAVINAASKTNIIVTKLDPDWQHIFNAVTPDMPLSKAQRSLLTLAKEFKATAESKVVTGRNPALLEYALTREVSSSKGLKDLAQITIALTDKMAVTVSRTSVDVQSDMVIWRGVVDKTGAGATLMWWLNGTMVGTIGHNGHFYSIRHLGDRTYAVVEMDEARMPPDHAAMPPMMLVSRDLTQHDDPLVQQGDASVMRPATMGTSRAKSRTAEPSRKREGGSTGVASGDIIIDVIVAYTEKAASNYTDIERELVDLAIEEANESFRLSNLGHVKLKLVHAYQTGYVEEGAHFDHVWRFADEGDGYMEEIHRLRDRYRADVAVLVVDDARGCGLATRVHADADEAFAVVHHVCAAVTYSLAHEIGHLIGARHDLSIDKTMTPFPYGHGYINGTKWRDIMGYKESCGGCPRIPVWSNPKVRVKGDPAGTAQLYNARVIAEQAARVAAFR